MAGNNCSPTASNISLNPRISERNEALIFRSPPLEREGGRSSVSAGTGGRSSVSAGTGGRSSVSAGTGGRSSVSAETGGRSSVSAGTGGGAPSPLEREGGAPSPLERGRAELRLRWNGRRSSVSAGTGGRSSVTAGTGGRSSVTAGEVVQFCLTLLLAGGSDDVAVRPGGSSTGEGFVCIPFRLPSPARSSRPLPEGEVTHPQPPTIPRR